MNQLETLHDNDPKSYWQLLNELRGVTETDEKSTAVDPSSWVPHFTNLNTIKDNFKKRVKELDSLLDTLEKQKLFNELDKTISQKEITDAISKLKYNKSPGLDNLSNNMLKSGQLVLLHSLQKLFNACFTQYNGLMDSYTYS